MNVRVDTGEVVAAAGLLQAEADAARRLASGLTGLVRDDAGPLDGALREGLRVLADICGDVLEVVALDLDLLAATARAGAWAYDAVEADVLRATDAGREPR